MSFFNIFSKKGKKEKKKKEELTEMKNISSFEELFEKYGAISFEKQQNIIDVIDNLKWELDLETGQLEFGNEISYPIQIYGTFSNRTGSWLWIWDNSIDDYQEEIVKMANLIKAYGEKNNIQEFTEPYYPLSKEDLEKMAMVILGLTGEGFYFLGDFGPGNILVSIKEEKFNKDLIISPIKVTNYFPRFISQYDVNHKKAFKHYVKAKGFETIETKRSVHATFTSRYSDVKMEVDATFDKLDRLINLDGTFSD